MQAGKFRTPLTLKRNSITQNSSGEDVITPTTLGVYWADVQPMTGREMEAVSQRWAEARFRITARYRPDIEMRRADHLYWGTRTLDVLDAEADAKKHVLTIYAKEFTA